MPIYSLYALILNNIKDNNSFSFNIFTSLPLFSLNSSSEFSFNKELYYSYNNTFNSNSNLNNKSPLLLSLISTKTSKSALFSMSKEYLIIAYA
jgi:hypothetical protein